VARQSRPWLANRDAIERSAESRRFVDEILSDLSSRHFVPSAWGDFLGRSLVRSVAQIRIRPAAATEVTVLHLLASAGNRSWAFGSWLMCITHLGLLGERSTLGWPNRITLIRALLPALAPNSRWTSLVAVATDFADGRIAQRREESAFGAFADPIADGVFWSWFALRWEPNRWLRLVPITLFVSSVAGISAAYFARGRTIDYPRLQAIRYASAAAQILLTLRAVRSIAR
jgi:phosphatidylglycerophosphate synthase